jgi:exopolyphosphatase/guanosine-5'-triphosphate,3'-diphosphate pyrophosphatase
MKYAAIDIGTNSVLCLICEIKKKSSSLNVLIDLARIARLGQGLNQGHELLPEAMDRTLNILKDYQKEIIKCSVPPENIFVLATAGMRKAKNAEVFSQQIKDQLDWDLQIINGQKEAYLSYLGVWHGLKEKLSQDKPMIIMDIGGGSTELVRVNLQNKEPMENSMSLRLGSVWLTEKYLQDQDPPSSRTLQAMTKEIDQILSDSPMNWQDNPQVIGIAGTVTTLAAMAENLETYDPSIVHGKELTQDIIEKLFKKMIALPLAQRKKLAGLEPQRADVILAGTIIANRVLTKSQSKTLLVSDQGLRYGIIYETIFS